MILPVADPYEIYSPFVSRKITFMAFRTITFQEFIIDYLHMSDVEKHYRYN